jgi:cysteine desulfurase
VPLLAVIHGGGQEKGGRSGTENVSAIVGLAKAAEYVNGKRQLEQRRVTALRDYFIDQLLSIKGVVVNGDRSERIANNVNISVPGKDNEFIVLNLDAQGVACSTKSSCLREKALKSPDHPFVFHSDMRLTRGISTALSRFLKGFLHK